MAPSAVEYIGPGTVAVLLEGVPDGVAARARQTAELLGENAESSETAPDGWGRYPDGTTLIDISAPPPSLRDVLTLLGPDVALTWSGSGHGQVGLAAEMTPEDVADVLGRLRDVLGRHRGHAVVRYAPEEVRGEIDLWGRFRRSH